MAKLAKPQQKKDTPPPDPSDRRPFRDWLAGRPRRWSIVMAARAALRALPLTKINDEQIPTIMLQMFRAAAVLRLATIHRKKKFMVPARDASEAAYDAYNASRTAKSEDSASRAITAAVFSVKQSNISNALDDAADAIASAAAAYAPSAAATREEARQLNDKTQTIERLAATPLWPHHAPAKIGPVGIEDSWRLLVVKLRSLGSNWSIWIKWYEDVLYGMSRSEAEVVAFTDVSSKLPWDDGAEAVNTEIKRRLERLGSPTGGSKQHGRTPANSLPSQGPGPHFVVAPNNLIDRAAASDIDGSGNNVARIRQLRPLAQQCAATLSRYLAGNKYPELEAVVRKYEAAIARDDESEIPWGEVFGLGVFLQNAADAARREIKDRLLPELEDSAETALDTLLKLHGPMILASREGNELDAQAEAFQMSGAETAALADAAKAVVERLGESEDIATKLVISDVTEAADAIDKGRHRERGTIFGIAALKNVSLALVATAAVSPPLLLGLVAGIPGAVAGGALSLIGIEGLKKSATFVAIATQLGAKIDAMTGPVLEAWIAKRIGAAAPFQDFVLKNEDALRRIAEATPELRWMIDYIDLIKRNRDPGP